MASKKKVTVKRPVSIPKAMPKGKKPKYGLIGCAALAFILSTACADQFDNSLDSPNEITVDVSGDRLEENNIIGTSEQDLIGNTATNPNHLTFWWYAGDPTVLRPAIECALERIRVATCLPVDVSFDAYHWVRQRTPADLAPFAAHSNGSFDESRMSISTNYTGFGACQLLIHEMFHTLRRSNSHPCPSHAMSYPTVNIGEPVSTITQCDLDYICAKQSCGCQVPE